MRLYPIRYRRLDKTNQFKRFDLVEMVISKASDLRPESYHVDENSIQLIESAKKISERSKVQLWKPFIAPSLVALLEENRQTQRSLGIIKPDPDSIKFKINQVTESDRKDQQIANLVFHQQASLLENKLKPLARPKYSFSYHYTCDGHPHKHQIFDWEVQAAFIHYKSRYKTEDDDAGVSTEHP